MIPTISATFSVVVDASALVDAILDARRFAARIATYRLHAPVTIDAEVVQWVRKRWLLKQLSDRNAEAAIEAFQAHPIIRYAIVPLVGRMWAIRQNVTAYDASYVALAESLNIPLITRDRRLAHSSGHTARIELLDS
jgi:predicted nucleic acid-binding protein